MLRIIKFAAKNGLIVNVLTLLILVGGMFKVAQMRREAFPAIKVDYIWVITQYPGAGPREVERYVTDPLEREIEQVDGIKRIDSSSVEGLSKITIEIDPDLTELEKDRVVTEVQRAVDQAPDLPNDLPDPPAVHRLDSAKNPIVDITLGGDIPFAELYAIGERYQEHIENIPDVDELDWRAKRDREFHVALDPSRLRRYQVGSDQVVAALAAQNVNLPGGSFETDDGELLLRSVGELKSVADIENVVVASNLGGQVVRIRDLGTVQPAFSDETIRVRANGKPVLLFSAMIDATSGDIIRAVEKIRSETDRFLRELGDERLEVTFINDMSEQVRDRLTVLGSNGLIGIALVVIVLLLFLSRGIALITALGMPVALIGALLVMAYSGVTLNLITMFAMILVIGMLVDDAIIVAENIWHHYEQGDDPWTATVNGTTEVMWPVIATISTTIAAFSPMLMVSGIFGKFIRWMPITVIIMLLLSLFEALLILPSHAYDMLKFREWRHRRQQARGKGRSETPAPAQRGAGRLHTFFVHHYTRLLGQVIRFRYLFVTLICGVLGFSLWWAETQMRLELFPNDEMDAFFIRAKLPIRASMEETAEAFRAIEELVHTLPAHELENVVTYIGLIQNDPGDPFAENGSNIGQVAVYLTPLADRERTAQEIMEDLRGKMPEVAQRAGFTTWNLDPVRTGPPVGKPIAIQIRGDDYGQLFEIAQQVQREVEAVPGTKDITLDYSRGKDEVLITIDKVAASRALLTPADISRQILTAFEGSIATWIRDAGDRIPVRVKFREPRERTLAALDDIELSNAHGRLIPLREVARFEVRPGVRQLLHRDGFRTIQLTANIDTTRTDSTRVNEALLPKMRAIEEAHPGIFIKLGGEYEETTDSMKSLFEALAVALGLIFMILTLQFGSVTQPFVVMAAIPFGMVGMIWAFHFHGMPLSFVGLLGLVGLTGVVVNDSIVLMDFINKARDNGMSVKEAAIYAGGRRFRAVWLTTITTVMGLLPTVYGIGGMDRFIRPAAVTMGYGLFFGTVLALLFVPALYVIRTDIGRMLLWLGRKLFGEVPPEPELEEKHPPQPPRPPVVQT